MLSMMPLRIAETNRISMVATSASPPVARAAASASVPITPVFTKAPIMMNRPVKKSRVSHSTLGIKSPGLLRESNTSSPAEERHDRGLNVEGGVSDKPGEHACEHDAADDQQSTVLDSFAFFQGHYVGYALGIDGERAAEQHRQHGDEHG